MLWAANIILLTNCHIKSNHIKVHIHEGLLHFSYANHGKSDIKLYSFFKKAPSVVCHSPPFAFVIILNKDLFSSKETKTVNKQFYHQFYHFTFRDETEKRHCHHNAH